MLLEEDLAFLGELRVGRLATADREGHPHVVPVCFAIRAGRIYVPVDAKPKSGDPLKLKRLRNIGERPEAVLLLDHYEDDWRQLRWLSVRARARLLVDGDERADALAVLEGRYPQYTAMQLSRLGLPVIALEPTAVSRWSAVD